MSEVKVGFEYSWNTDLMWSLHLETAFDVFQKMKLPLGYFHMNWEAILMWRQGREQYRENSD